MHICFGKVTHLMNRAGTLNAQCALQALSMRLRGFVFGDMTLPKILMHESCLHLRVGNYGQLSVRSISVGPKCPVGAVDIKVGCDRFGPIA
jgi:hypothetical protein